MDLIEIVVWVWFFIGIILPDSDPDPSKAWVNERS
jgi:hypothetical protein